MVLLAILRTLAPAAATPHQPFAMYAGSWSGAGTISTTSGTNERIRCRASYEVAPSGLDLHQNLRCASDTYRFDVSSDVVYLDGGVSGTWSETSRRVTGRVSGTIEGTTLRVNVDGPGFTAALALVTRGNTQVVSIRPQGGDVVSIAIQLSRS
ncbi:MAG: hypothetical protein JO163_10055 [Methylobacteriaceae bacterium]|nr:hypothetical protein [Methylobacteriaceae bacterium]MBV9703061.1 hypothetical protein [Methylobacteriaceae bacterium]